jgi:hypothetical protein
LSAPQPRHTVAPSGISIRQNGHNSDMAESRGGDFRFCAGSGTGGNRSGLRLLPSAPARQTVNRTWLDANRVRHQISQGKANAA